MATEIERLVVRMEANTAKFEAAMSKASRSAYGAAAKIKKDLGGVEESLNSIASRVPGVGSLLSGLGIAGGVAAAGVLGLVGALTQARAAMKFADDISDTAKKLHVTTDALQEYRYAIVQAGGETDGADKALESFSQQLGLAQAQMPKAVKAFKELGFTQPQIDSFQTVDEALKAVTDRIAHLPTQQQDAVIKQLGLNDLKPLILDGVDAMERLRQKAHDVGVVMDADLLRRAAEANDKFDELSQVIDVELKSAFVDLAPVLVGLVQLAANLARTVGGMIDQIRSVEDKSLEGLHTQRARLRSQTLALETVHGGPDPTQRGLIARNKQLTSQLDAEIAKREADRRASAPPVPTTTLIPQGRTSSRSAHAAPRAEVDRSDQAIASAAAEELRARKAYLSTVLDTIGEAVGREALIKQIADLDGEEIEARREERNRRIAEDKAVSAAAKAKATALSDEVAGHENAALALQRQAQLREEAQRQNEKSAEIDAQIEGYKRDILQAQAEGAVTEEEQARIQSALLILAQEEERRALEKKIIDEQINDAKADQLRAALAIKQGAEREASRFQGPGVADARRQAGQTADDIKSRDNIDARYGAMYEQIANDTTLTEQEQSEARLKIYGDEFGERLSYARGFFDQLSSLSQSGNKKLAAIGKAAALAMATIDGAQAVIKALGSGPFPLNIAMAAATAAAVAVQIAKITSSGYATGTASARPGMALVGERGPELVKFRGGEGVVPNHRVMDEINRGSLANNSGARHVTVHQQINLHAEGAVLASELIDTLDRTSRTYAFHAAQITLEQTPAKMMQHRQLQG
jgi:hypothetical protein